MSEDRDYVIRELERLLAELSIHDETQERTEVTLREAMDKWLRYCRAEHLAEGTIEGYRARVRKFFRAGDIHLDQPVSDITLDVVVRTVESLRAGCRLAPATVSSIASTARVFLRYCDRTGIRIHPSVRGNMPTIRVPSKEIRCLTLDEVRRLLAVPDTSTWAGKRDRCWITLALDTGIRRGEIRNLHLEDVQPPELVIRQGKGRKDRRLVMSEDMVRELRSYIRAWKSFKPRLKEHGYLFPSWFGPMGPSLPNTMLRRYSAQASPPIVPHVRTHDLRRTYATMFLMRDAETGAPGGSIQNLRDNLGHTDIRMSLKYAARANGDAGLESTMFSPIARLGRGKGS